MRRRGNERSRRSWTESSRCIGWSNLYQINITLSGEVSVYVEEDKTFYEKGLKDNVLKDYHNCEEYKKLVAEYLESGWELRNNKRLVEREKV